MVVFKQTVAPVILIVGVGLIVIEEVVVAVQPLTVMAVSV
jgi:hypothetical protein